MRTVYDAGEAAEHVYAAQLGGGFVERSGYASSVGDVDFLCDNVGVGKFLLQGGYGGGAMRRIEVEEGETKSTVLEEGTGGFKC